MLCVKVRNSKCCHWFGSCCYCCCRCIWQQLSAKTFNISHRRPGGTEEEKLQPCTLFIISLFSRCSYLSTVYNSISVCNEFYFLHPLTHYLQCAHTHSHMHTVSIQMSFRTPQADHSSNTPSNNQQPHSVIHTFCCAAAVVYVCV